MKNNHQLLVMAVALIALRASSFASSNTQSASSANQNGTGISDYIYVSGSGYSLNKKPYKWQAEPPKGSTVWITNDPNQPTIPSVHLKGPSGDKTWQAIGGVPDSNAPSVHRTEFWHPLKESDGKGHVKFSVGIQLAASSPNRPDDTFGWAFKDTSGKALFQILFKPDKTNPKHSLDVWQYDQNGKGTQTPLKLAFGQNYNLVIDYNPATQSFIGSISNGGHSWNIAGTVNGSNGHGAGGDFKVGSVVAVWILNGPGYGNNFMAFTDYNFNPTLGQLNAFGGGAGNNSSAGSSALVPVILPPPSAPPLTSH